MAAANHDRTKEGALSSPDSDKAPPGDPKSAYLLPVDYPPSMGYPQDQPGYPVHIYNNRSYNDRNCPYPPNQFIPPQSQRMLSELRRNIIAGLVFVSVFSCLIGVVMWLMSRTSLPTFQLVNFSVKNFNTINPAHFTADWEANVAVKNLDPKLDIFFDKIQIDIYREKDRLATTGFAPILINKKKSIPMNVKLSAGKGVVPAPPPATVVKMADEKKRTGQVSVSLRMMLSGSYKLGKKSSKKVSVKVSCEGLKLGFIRINANNGNLTNGNLSKCKVTAG